MAPSPVGGETGKRLLVPLPVLVVACFGFVAALSFEAYHRWAGLADAVEARAAQLQEKFAKRVTILGLFVELAREAENDEDLRRQARQITRAVEGWLVISRPGEMMEIEFSSLGDGSVPPPVPRRDHYASLIGAEQMAAASGKPVFSDIFHARTSGLPSVALVIEADLPQGTRFVYLAQGVESLMRGLTGFGSGDVGFALIDGSGAVAEPEVQAGQHEVVHTHDNALHRWLHVSHSTTVFGTWTLRGEEHVVATETVVHAALVAVALGLLTWVALGASGGRIVPQAADGPSDAERDRDTREQLGLVLTLGHELRSPLISLLSAIDLVKRSPNEAARAFLDHATHEAHSLLRLIDDMLACAKISADGIAVNEEIYTPADLVATCVKTVSAGAETAVPIEIVGCASVGPLVGDHAKIRQILLNFLSNAVKFADGQKVGVGCCAVAEAADRVTIRFSVTDAGRGIPAARQPDVFRRVGVAGSASGPSSNGLGLMTARLLAEAIGAQVGCESVEGEGSTFWVELTQRKATELASAPVPVAQARLPEGLSVLLAEDDPIIRLMIANDLERAGAQVESVGSGEEAMEALRYDHFDVLITDIRMDGLSGHDLAAEVRREMTQPPVLAGISAHYAVAEDVAPSGLFDFILEKPFSIVAFAAQIAAIPALNGAAGHDEAQIARVLDIFGDRRAALVDEIVQSLQRGLDLCLTSGDPVEVGKSAHRLAGLVLTFGARGLGRKLLRIEALCAEGKLEEARVAAQEARAETDRLLAYLTPRAA